MDHQQAATEMMVTVTDVCAAYQIILAFDTHKLCSLVFPSFPTRGFISIILDCWCFSYELLCNQFTLLVRIIIYWKNLKDAFFLL